MRVTRSPTPTPRDRARCEPRTIFQSPGLSGFRSSVFRCSRMVETWDSRSGSTPRMSAPETAFARVSKPWPYINGAPDSTLGWPVTVRVSSGQSCSQPFRALTVACDATLNIRSRSSRSKPFMTESTVISAHTPTVIPRMDTPEINETKWLRLRARV